MTLYSTDPTAVYTRVSTYTNRIEAYWGILKGQISKRQCTDEQLNYLLLEEEWRHQNKDNLGEGL